MTSAQESKKCQVCKQTKNILEFNFNRAYTNGDIICMSCRSIIRKKTKEDAPPVPAAHPMYRLYRIYKKRAGLHRKSKREAVAQAYDNAALELSKWVYIYGDNAR